MSGREESPMPLNPIRGALGDIYLVGRKEGKDMQSFPIDAERVTIGRDLDCDIRLYYPDVSLLHAEIRFDLLTGQAVLIVHGPNGINYVPANGVPSKQIPPASLPLSNKDTFIIRKKLFRFEYTTQELTALESTPSPAKTATPIRRRASHRLSLVPAGKEFIPLSPGGLRTPAKIGKTPAKSNLGLETITGDDAPQGIVVVEGEGGDRVYLEEKDVTCDAAAYEESPPKNVHRTPRSIPLPPSSETPYQAAPTPEPKITARVALATPKGSSSLRKSLLLHSARKVWETSRSTGVEGAIESGEVEVRRKSLSPKVGTPKRVPMPVDEEEEEVEEDGEAEEEREEELKWVYEDGKANTFLGDSDESMDSFEADMSLDIPGGGVIDFQHDEEEEAINESSAEKEEDEIGVEDEEEIDDEDGEELDNEEEEFRLEVGQTPDEDDEEAQPPLPGTPAARRALERFYTPQIRRNQAAGPRRSLAGIGGPPVRFQREVATPGSNGASGVRVKPAPGTLGKPSRRVGTPQKPKIEEPAVEPEQISTPVRIQASPAMLAEAKRRRESLATPMALPSVPTRGFKTPVNDQVLRNLTPARTHPALAPDSPEQHDQPQLPVPDTPINGLKARLADLRRQSLHGRRATVGFAIPQTPDRPQIKQSASFTNPARRYVPPSPGKTSNQPELSSEVHSLQSYVTSPTDYYGRGGKIEEEEEEALMPDEKYGKAPGISPPTPTFANHHTLPKARAEVKTPYMAGIRSLFPATPTEQPSPSLAGIRGIFRLPSKVAPPTPVLKGLFNIKKIPPTPKMEGLSEMYELEEEEEVEEIEEDVMDIVEGEEEQEEEEEKVEAEEVVELYQSEQGERVISSPSVLRAAGSKRKAPSTSKLNTSTSSRAKKEPAVKSAPSVSRVKRGPEVEEPKSKPSRGKKAASSSAEEPVLKPSRGKRSTAEPEVAVPAVPKSAMSSDEPVSKPSRGKRSTAEPEVTVPAAPTRSRRNTTEEVEVVSAPMPVKASRARVAKVKTEGPGSIQEVAEPEELSASRSRSTSSRSKRVAPTIIEDVEAAGAGRKKVLGDSTDQEEVSSKPSRGKKATGTSAAAKKPAPVPAPAAPTEDKISVSAPSRRKPAPPASTSGSNDETIKTTTSTSAPSRRKVVDKENDPEEAELGVGPKSKSVKRATKVVPVAETVVAPAVRATRSRK